MLKQYFITTILLYFLLTSCDSNSTNNKSRQSDEKQNITIPTKETVDNNFFDFIEKFSTDSSFQMSRTKFPLTIKRYDIDKDRDLLIHRDKSEFEMMDFRKKKSNSQHDNWEQKIVIDKNNKSATIEIRGIDNGIMVDYLFEKINEVWMLIEINDSST